jgi:hypothetical protein
MSRTLFAIRFLVVLGGIATGIGIGFAPDAHAAPKTGKPRVVYPKESRVDFDGLTLEGEVKNPGEFYFQRRPEEKFDSLVKRRKNFHREMLRDVVIAR